MPERFGGADLPRSENTWEITDSKADFGTKFNPIEFYNDFKNEFVKMNDEEQLRLYHSLQRLNGKMHNGQTKEQEIAGWLRLH